MAQTALITGASAGLGEKFAIALAAQGSDVILTARRADRLEALAKRITGESGQQAHVIASDLAAPGAVAALMTEISARGLAVHTLINNAGFGARGPFTELGGAMQSDMIDLNCRALVELSHAVLPAMIERGAGGILNVASTAAFQPGPWMAVYYASKAFVLSFSEALHEEVRGKGVRVACLCPGATKTEFADLADMGETRLFKMFAGDADAVVRDGLAALKANRAVAVSGMVNAVMAGAIRFTPRGLARGIAGAMQKG